MIKFNQVTLENCHTTTGLVVVIDVLRAFTTAAYAFAAGAKNIIMVSTVKEALAQRDRRPKALIMGEVEGRPVAGFDFGNSPSQLVNQDFSNRQLIQRTSAGVQGMVRSVQADTLLAGSFVCAQATIRYIQQQAPPSVTFVNTGVIYHRDGDEDIACADYLTARLQGQQPDPTPFLDRIYRSTSGQLFANSNQPELPREDLELAAELNRFNFAMQAVRRDGLLILEQLKI